KVLLLVAFVHQTTINVGAVDRTVIALDDQQRIVDTLFMKGLTVFARPQKIPAITGMYAGDLQPDVIFPNDPLSQNALSLALKLKRG
ncbi:transcriptional regulator GutM, partial [Escherichia coli]|uniref:transcriptional regulator GutM n=1 Tax=Escherichia coli TaxID=562 RepID=UPI002B2648FA